MRSIKILEFILLAIGISGIIILFQTYAIEFQRNVLSFNKPIPKFTGLTTKYSTPISIFISKLNISLPVKETNIINGTWQVFDESANFLETSARLGEQGNIIIYGHNQNKVLGKLIGGKTSYH